MVVICGEQINMKRVVVFCGASAGNLPVYAEAAYELGKTLAQSGIGLVYGGAQIGLMGAVAEGALDAGGEVIGVIPHFLDAKEIAHEGLTEMFRVETMHQRKAKMSALSDGIIALPGGFGTLEELFEMLTWGQLGLHPKPIGLLNVGGFYDDLLQFVATMVASGLLRAEHSAMILVSDTIKDLLQQMHKYVAPEAPKWLSSNQT